MARKKKHFAAGCLFWATLVIVLAIAAIAAREPIEKAFGQLFGEKPTVVVNPLSNNAAENPPASSTTGQKPVTVAPESPQTATPSASGSSFTAATSQKPAASGSAAAGTTAPAATAQKPAAVEEKPAVRKTMLYFAGIDANGAFVLRPVPRTIASSDSPLRDTLMTMIEGPTSQEMNKGLISMIPSTTRLLSVAVKGDVAYIDFSEGFRFNTHGREGLDTQLKQVVYAATEYPTVKKVQVLIEGKKVEFLGPEGIRIDAPLGRQSFPE